MAYNTDNKLKDTASVITELCIEYLYNQTKIHEQDQLARYQSNNGNNDSSLSGVTFRLPLTLSSPRKLLLTLSVRKEELAAMDKKKRQVESEWVAPTSESSYCSRHSGNYYTRGYWTDAYYKFPKGYDDLKDIITHNKRLLVLSMSRFKLLCSEKNIPHTLIVLLCERLEDDALRNASIHKGDSNMIEIKEDDIMHAAGKLAFDLALKQLNKEATPPKKQTKKTSTKNKPTKESASSNEADESEKFGRAIKALLPQPHITLRLYETLEPRYQDFLIDLLLEIENVSYYLFHDVIQNNDLDTKQKLQMLSKIILSVLSAYGNPDQPHKTINNEFCKFIQLIERYPFDNSFFDFSEEISTKNKPTEESASSNEADELGKFGRTIKALLPRFHALLSLYEELEPRYKGYLIGLLLDEKNVSNQLFYNVTKNHDLLEEKQQLLMSLKIILTVSSIYGNPDQPDKTVNKELCSFIQLIEGYYFFDDFFNLFTKLKPFKNTKLLQCITDVLDNTDCAWEQLYKHLRESAPEFLDNFDDEQPEEEAIYDKPSQVNRSYYYFQCHAYGNFDQIPVHVREGIEGDTPPADITPSLYPDLESNDDPMAMASAPPADITPSLYPDLEPNDDPMAMASATPEILYPEYFNRIITEYLFLNLPQVEASPPPWEHRHAETSVPPMSALVGKSSLFTPEDINRITNPLCQVEASAPQLEVRQVKSNFGF